MYSRIHFEQAIVGAMAPHSMRALLRMHVSVLNHSGSVSPLLNISDVSSLFRHCNSKYAYRAPAGRNNTGGRNLVTYDPPSIRHALPVLDDAYFKVCTTLHCLVVVVDFLLETMGYLMLAVPII